MAVNICSKSVQTWSRGKWTRVVSETVDNCNCCACKDAVSFNIFVHQKWSYSLTTVWDGLKQVLLGKRTLPGYRFHVRRLVRCASKGLPAIRYRHAVTDSAFTDDVGRLVRLHAKLAAEIFHDGAYQSRVAGRFFAPYLAK